MLEAERVFATSINLTSCLSIKKARRPSIHGQAAQCSKICKKVQPRVQTTGENHGQTTSANHGCKPRAQTMGANHGYSYTHFLHCFFLFLTYCVITQLSNAHVWKGLVVICLWIEEVFHLHSMVQICEKDPIEEKYLGWGLRSFIGGFWKSQQHRASTAPIPNNSALLMINS